MGPHVIPQSRRTIIPDKWSDYLLTGIGLRDFCPGRVSDGAYPVEGPHGVLEGRGVPPIEAAVRVRDCTPGEGGGE